MVAAFPSNRNVFLNGFSIPAGGNRLFCLVEIIFFYLEISVLFAETGRSNFWKITLFLLVETGFLASGKHFFLPFWDTPATNFIFPSCGNVFLNAFRVERDFLASGNTSFIYFSGISTGDLCRYQTFMLVFFLVKWKHIFETNPSFWPVETDFLASGKHFVPLSQISLPLEVVFPSLGNIF